MEIMANILRFRSEMQYDLIEAERHPCLWDDPDCLKTNSLSNMPFRNYWNFLRSIPLIKTKNKLNLEKNTISGSLPFTTPEVIYSSISPKLTTKWSFLYGKSTHESLTFALRPPILSCHNSVMKPLSVWGSIR